MRTTASMKSSSSNKSNNPKPRTLYLILSIVAITIISQSILVQDYYYYYYYNNCNNSNVGGGYGLRRSQQNYMNTEKTAQLTSLQPAPQPRSIIDNKQCMDWKSTRMMNIQSQQNEPKITLDNQRHFALGGYNQIARGSGEIVLAGPILNLISKQQHSPDHRIYGSVGELGVHHGRFTAFLFVTSRQHEQLVVGDLFEKMQSANVDKSGLGDLKRFVQGLQTYGLTPTHLHTIYVGSTSNLPFNWSYEQKFHPFRLISIDASHT